MKKNAGKYAVGALSTVFLGDLVEMVWIYEATKN